ncbi:MAG: VOC family protein [Siphonobacter aquaeclarae]|nr:VOC family protein [Siphonobacter aquaeclarae]
MSQLHAYLNLSGRCREAMLFYQGCLGGELSLLTVEDSPMADQWPPHLGKHILHASLVQDELVLLGSDVGGPVTPAPEPMISLALTCGSEEELRRQFEVLSAGGKIQQPVHAFFDGWIGSVTDRFGIHWILKY